MLHKKTPFIIVSVEQSSAPMEVNSHNMKAFIDWLNHSNIAFKPVDGVYGGVSEDSFIIPLPNDLAARENLLFKVCGWLTAFNQECYLYSDTHGYCTLHNTGGVVIDRLGLYRIVENMPQGDHTYLGNNLYMVV